MSVANLNQYIRDQLDAILAGMKGDASVDADMWQAIKTGTLSARSGVAHVAGRMYFTTDTLQSFISDGTRWQHITGRGAFDSFDRTTSTTLGNAESGHPWIEESGDVQINASGEMENVSGTGIATVDTGGVLHSADYYCELKSGATIASFEPAVILRYVDASNYLRFRLSGSTNTAFLAKTEGGVGVTIGSPVGVTLVANSSYPIRVSLRGSVIHVVGYSPTTPFTPIFSFNYADDEELYGSYVNTATKAGVLLVNTTNSKCAAFSVKP